MEYTIIETIEFPDNLESCIGCPLAYDSPWGDLNCGLRYWEDECKILKHIAKEKQNETIR